MRVLDGALLTLGLGMMLTVTGPELAWRSLDDSRRPVAPTAGARPPGPASAVASRPAFDPVPPGSLAVDAPDCLGIPLDAGFAPEDRACYCPGRCPLLGADPPAPSAAGGGDQGVATMYAIQAGESSPLTLFRNTPLPSPSSSAPSQ